MNIIYVKQKPSLYHNSDTGTEIAEYALGQFINIRHGSSPKSESVNQIPDKKKGSTPAHGVKPEERKVTPRDSYLSMNTSVQF
jgi:hypothetical protein